MNLTPKLGELDRERFTDAVEAAYSVSSRPQFFVWSQSALRALVPHEVLICGIEVNSRQGLALHRFISCRYFRQEHFDAVADPLKGLAPQLLGLADSGQSSVVYCPGMRENGSDPGLRALLGANELRNVVAYLVWNPQGRVAAFYAFARVSVELGPQLAYIVELLGPHLHNTFLRVLAGERDVASAQGHRTSQLVTPRQYEILRLIKSGKTNAEIAVSLSCSQWTIKNHVQVILRKLETNSRTHAIAKAMSLGILQPD